MANIKCTHFEGAVLRAQPPSGNTGRLVSALDEAMDYASRVGVETSLLAFDLLNELEVTVDEMFRTG